MNNKTVRVDGYDDRRKVRNLNDIKQPLAGRVTKGQGYKTELRVVTSQTELY